MKPAGKKEARKTRPIRCTDAEWADFLLVTAAKARALISKEAARLRRKMKPNADVTGLAPAQEITK